MGAERNQRLPGARGRGDDGVVARENRQQRLLLVRVQRDPRGLHPPGEDIEEGIGGGIPGQEVAEVRHDVPDSPTKPKQGSRALLPEAGTAIRAPGNRHPRAVGFL